jgi:hypothetical protein
MRISRLLAVAVSAAVSVGLLAGCAPAAPPSTATPAPTATATPTPEAPAAPASLTFTQSAVTIATAAGDTLETFDYFTPAADAVAVLTEAFGAAPTEEHVQGYEQPGYTRYEWGGFQLHALDEGADRFPPLRVQAVVTRVGDVLIATVDNVSVGQDADTVAARYPDTTETFTPPGTSVERYAIRAGSGILTGPDGTSYQVYVGLGGEVGGPITTITAPQVGSGSGTTQY